MTEWTEILSYHHENPILLSEILENRPVAADGYKLINFYRLDCLGSIDSYRVGFHMLNMIYLPTYLHLNRFVRTLLLGVAYYRLSRKFKFAF